MTNATLYSAPTEAYLFEPVGGGAGSALVIGDGGYEVVEDWTGPSSAEPTSASIVYFDGPLSPAAYDAGQRGSRDRIQPALRVVPGVARLLALWDSERRRVAVILMADSLATVERAGTVISTTELLPDEDPALLPGPDRAEVVRIVGHIRK